MAAIGDVVRMIVDEVITGEGAVQACRFVEHRDMRLDAVLRTQRTPP